MHSITSDELNKVAYGALNSIAVDSPNKLYVSRYTSPLPPYGTHRNPLIEMVSANILKPTGVYWIEYDPSSKEVKMKEAAMGFAMANGVAFDLEKKHLWIADSFAKTVSKYERNMTTNELTKHNEVKVGYLIDNLKYCEFSDRLYAGAVSSVWHLSQALNPRE